MKLKKFLKRKREPSKGMFVPVLSKWRFRKLIQELQNLNDNIAALNVTIAAAVEKLTAPHATPAEVQAAADAVASATAVLQAGVDAGS